MGEPKTIAEHIEELRNRLFVVVLFLVATSAMAYVLQKPLVNLIVRPLAGQQLIYTSPFGGLQFVLKIAIFVGLTATIPLLLYQIVRFAEPGVFMAKTIRPLRLVVASALLAITGAAFAYVVALPAALHFLGSVNAEHLVAMVATNEYLSFFMVYLAGFALIFQLPLILWVINTIHRLDPPRLLRRSRYIIVGSFVVAAIITPTPDPINQAIMAAPALVLFPLSLGMIWLLNRRPTPRLAEVVPPSSSVVTPPVVRRPRPVRTINDVFVTKTYKLKEGI